jgi:hypothetical protein
MKQEFLRLLEANYDDKYIEGIDDPMHAAVIRAAFANGDFNAGESFLEEYLFKVVESDECKSFANPYFVGFGNPASDILVIGKEKAFPADNVKLLIKESINNYRQWKAVVDGDLFQMDPVEIVAKLGYNPLLPKSYHSGKTKGNHTWSKTCSIISQVFPERKLIVDEGIDFKRSFFNSCFLTELNHRPAKYHEGSGLHQDRKSFLCSPFFKSFPVVIFSAKSYLRTTDNILEELFGIKSTHGQEIELDRVGKNKDKPKCVTKYLTTSQSIYVCDQLSGSSGWSNKSLGNFAEEIKSDLAVRKAFYC